MNIARRTKPGEGAISSRFCPQGKTVDKHWKTVVTKPDGLRSARTDARNFLLRNSVSPTCSDKIVLTLSELLSNAITGLASGGLVTAELNCRRPHLVTLMVMNDLLDEWPRLPGSVGSMPPPEVPHGRGLPLVAALADRLSIDTCPGTMRVWADFVRKPFVVAL